MKKYIMMGLMGLLVVFSVCVPSWAQNCASGEYEVNCTHSECANTVCSATDSATLCDSCDQNPTCAVECSGCGYKPDCVDKDDSGFCDVCNTKFVCGTCGKNPCNCPCPTCGHINGSCTCSICSICGSKTCVSEECKARYDDYKDGNPENLLSQDEFFAIEKFFNEKYGDSGLDFSEWLNNYDSNYSEFVSVMKLAGYTNFPGLSEFILQIESTIDPINIITAELYFTETDISIPTPGIPLVFERFYASEEGWRNTYEWKFQAINDEYMSSRSVNVLGDYGTWAGLISKVFTNSADVEIVEEDLHYILVKTGKGEDYRFEVSDTEQGVFFAEAMDWKVVFEAVVEEETTNGYQFVIHQPAGIKYAFDGRNLDSIGDEWGNRIDFTYFTNSLLAQHTCGTSLLLEHDGNINKPTRAYVSDDLYVNYKYDSSGNLTNTVRHIDGETYEFSYEYDVNGKMNKKTSPREDEYQFAHAETCFNFVNDGREEPNPHYIETEDSTRTTTLQIGDGWMKHKVEAEWGWQYLGVYEYGEWIEHAEEYRNSTVTYDYGSGLEKKYHYGIYDGIIRNKYGPYTSSYVNKEIGVDYTYTNKNITIEKTFDNTVDETFLTHKQYDEFSHITAVGVSYNSETPVWQTQITYDPIYHLPATITNAEGHRNEISYVKGLPDCQKAYYSDTESYDTNFGYYTNGLVKAVTNANEHVINMEYDILGNLTLTSSELGPVVSNTCTAFGFVECVEVLAEDGNRTGRIITCDVDAQGQINSVTDAELLVTTFEYDKAGSVTNIIDRAGRVTDYTYAPTKKLTSVTQYLKQGGTNVPIRISYDFDKMFNALKITEPRNRYVESYQLDLQDRVTSVTNIESQVMNIDYGVASFVRKITRFDRSVITNTYDVVGRKEHKTYLMGNQTNAVVNYSYYADSQLKSISDGTSNITNFYDRLNRLTSSSFAVASIVSETDYQYDPVGNLTNSIVSIDDTSILSFSYQYDAAERLKKISTTDDGQFDYLYNPTNGVIASVSNTVSGITTSYAYDIMDRATNMTYTAANGSLIRSFEYAYDASSMITNKTIISTLGTLSNDQYRYDSLNRLVSEEKSNSVSSAYSVVYNYDLAGNRTSIIENSITNTYTLGTGNRLASWGTQGSALYDIAGNTTNLVSNDGSNLNLNWDERYRLTSVTS